MVSASSFEIELQHAEDTVRLGDELASRVREGIVIALTGPLGAGKTTFARGVGRGLGVTELINSPTFTMINEYTTGSLPMFHLDLYRMGQVPDVNESGTGAPKEWLELELEELQGVRGVVLIEWADLMSDRWQALDHIKVELNYSTLNDEIDNADVQAGEVGRIARIFAAGPNSAQIVEAVKNIYFS